MSTNDRQMKLCLALLLLIIVFILIEARGAGEALIRRARSGYGGQGGDRRQRSAWVAAERVACGRHGWARHRPERAAVPVKVRGWGQEATLEGGLIRVHGV